jgi:hypothetical protein
MENLLTLSLIVSLAAIACTVISLFKSRYAGKEKNEDMKTILDLKEECVIMKRAIREATAMLTAEKQLTIIVYDHPEVDELLGAAYHAAPRLERERQLNEQTAKKTKTA